MKRLLFYIIFSSCFCILNAQELPILLPTRTLSFSTNEGTMMPVDVSPDGKSLLISLLGDIYSIPASGGAAHQITKGLAMNLSPVWSPDGRAMAYMSDSSGIMHLSVGSIDGRWMKTLDCWGYYTNASFPLWSPDGNFISLNGAVYSIASGRAIAEERVIPQPLRYSEDGTLIYYYDSSRVYVYDKVNNIRRAVSSALKNNIFKVLSPDVRWLSYVSESGIYRRLVVRDLNSNEERVLIDSMQDVPCHYSFSPDSRFIYIGYAGKIHRFTVSTGADTIIPFEANIKSELGALKYHQFRINDDPIEIKHIRSANTSPDGRLIVFSALNRLYIRDSLNRSVKVLAKQPFNQFQPVFSPDGKWIAYVSWCDTIGGYLWRVPAAGGTPERLTTVAGQYQHPCWSPDSKRIAVIKTPPVLLDRDNPGEGRIEVIQLKNKHIQYLKDTVFLWNHLSFSSNGNLLYQPYSKPYLETTPLLKEVSLITGKETLLAEGKSLGSLMNGSNLFKGISLSPDSRYIVYSLAEDLYLVLVSTLRCPTVLFDGRREFTAIRFANGTAPHWEQGGKLLSWSYGNHYFKINPDKIIEAAKATPMNKDARFVSITIKPDQIIKLKVTVPQYYGDGLLALKNVRIISMKGDEVIPQGVVVIRNRRIEAVGSIDKVTIPKGAKVMDMKGATIMPGMVDMHLHTRLPPNVFPQQSWMYLANLAYGVTTGRDPSSSYDSYGYAELLSSGRMIGPRLFSSGRAVRFFDGTVEMNNQQDAMDVVRKRITLGGLFVKQYALPERHQRQWLLKASDAEGVNMTNEGENDLLLNIGMIKDGSPGLEHNPKVTRLYRDVILLYAKSGTYFTPTLQVAPSEKQKEYFNSRYWSQPDDKLRRFTVSSNNVRHTANGAESLETILDPESKKIDSTLFLPSARFDAAIVREGGSVCMGSHGNDEGIGAQNELWALQLGGLTNMQALRAATLTGAEGLGLQQDIGSIEPGKIADLLILNKNPLDDIHNSREIRYVMKDGILYDSNTLNTLWPKFRKCPEWKMRTSKSENSKN